MRSLKNTLALGAFALVTLAAPAFAEDATTGRNPVTIPHPVRCLACGAEHDVVVSVGPKNTMTIKLQRTPATGNPRGN